MAISLEVAEHLPESAADDFTSSLTNLSDFVLFSAAIPFQGGIGHVNEQWLTYWVEKFSSRGYLAVDLVRKRIWENQEIPIWFRQNTLVFVKEERFSDLVFRSCASDHIPPEVYSFSFRKSIAPGIRLSILNLAQAFRRKFSTR